jgi:hypothetical protein
VAICLIKRMARGLGLRFLASQRQTVIRALFSAYPRAIPKWVGDSFSFLRRARIWTGFIAGFSADSVILDWIGICDYWTSLQLRPGMMSVRLSGGIAAC